MTRLQRVLAVLLLIALIELLCQYRCMAPVEDSPDPDQPGALLPPQEV